MTATETESNHKHRKTYLGGGDMAALMGVSPWKTALDVFLRKTGKAPPVEQNEKMSWGLLLEPVIMQEYARRTGFVVERGGFKMLDGCSYIGGHPDGFANGPSGRRLLEVKTASPFSKSKWDEEIPIDYQMQVQLYLHIYGLDLCTFVVLFGGQEMHTYDLRADPIMQHRLLTVAHRFWNEYVEKDIPPPPSTMAEWTEAKSEQAERTIELSPDSESTLVALVSVRSKIAALEEQEKHLAEQIINESRGGALSYRGAKIGGWIEKSRKASVIEARTWRQFSWKRTAELEKILGEEPFLRLGNLDS